MLFNQKCIVYHEETANGYLNRPETTTVQKGPYPCCTSLSGKKRDNYVQKMPQAEISIDMVLYGPAGMDILEGDIICLPVTVDEVTKEIILTGSEKYTASKPYKPRGHHTECIISLQRGV
ncbi:MAG TPA: hypothetical protein VHP38_17070 [Ruminiclostridium sp.]|nr:hypothetical protein [Ruminiclostridium sp.]